MNTKKPSKTRFQFLSFLYNWLPTFFWIVVIFYLSLSDSGLPEIKFKFILESDKIAHLGIYFVFNFLMIRSWVKTFSKTPFSFILIFASILSIGFGIIMEVLQKNITQSRLFDINDIYANIAGAIIGLIAFSVFKNSISRSSSDNRNKEL